MAPTTGRHDDVKDGHPTILKETPVNDSKTAVTGAGAPLPIDSQEAWDRDGFLILDSFLDDETLGTLRRAYDEVLSGQVAVEGDRQLGDITRQVIRPSRTHPMFADNAALQRGYAAARRLFGVDDVACTFDMLIYKPPGHPHETPWHQDQAYAELPYAPEGATSGMESIQFWVPLDDVDTTNGCMQFIAGFHTRPLLRHHVAAGDPSSDGRLLAIVDPEKRLDLSTAQVAEIPAGGATLHAHATPHYTGANLSTDRQRRAYIFTVTTQRSKASELA